jgi:hypothetical protein
MERRIVRDIRMVFSTPLESSHLPLINSTIFMAGNAININITVENTSVITNCCMGYIP